ncbi:MAG: glycosyltransferase family 39 protein [bacterium]|nr:glycosyltransferase family 39 protein [bacterium]
MNLKKCPIIAHPSTVSAMEHRLGNLSVALSALRFPFSRRLRAALSIFFLAAVILAPRLFDLGAFLTADEKRWQANTANFLNALAVGDFDHLLQQPHPGITTQWLGAVSVLSESWSARKLPLAAGLSVLLGMIGYVFFRLWGLGPAVLVTLLLAWNPPLVAHSRVYAMDALLAEFLVLSLGLLLLWLESRRTRYLIAAGIVGALAVLSKLPGLLLVPFTGLVLGFHPLVPLRRDSWGPGSWALRPGGGWKQGARALSLWCIAFVVTLAFVLPSVVTNTIPVLQNIAAFFSSGDYRELHQERSFFYVSTLAVASTPLQVAALCAFPVVWWASRGRRGRVQAAQVATLFLFALLFILEMSIGAKKGDRYLLPALALFDVVVAALAAWAWTASRATRFLAAVIVLCGLAWEGILLWQLHPYALAYVNPLFRPAATGKRMGWGEGLDRAAEYLNTKPNAGTLTVASFYPNEFAYRFHGRVVPLNQFTHEDVRYVVLYRAMLERGGDAWETKILEEFRRQTPEEVVFLNGLPYVWIYAR